MKGKILSLNLMFVMALSVGTSYAPVHSSGSNRSAGHNASHSNAGGRINDRTSGNNAVKPVTPVVPVVDPVIDPNGNGGQSGGNTPSPVVPPVPLPGSDPSILPPVDPNGGQNGGGQTQQSSWWQNISNKAKAFEANAGSWAQNVINKAKSAENAFVDKAANYTKDFVNHAEQAVVQKADQWSQAHKGGALADWYAGHQDQIHHAADNAANYINNGIIDPSTKYAHDQVNHVNEAVQQKVTEAQNNLINKTDNAVNNIAQTTQDIINKKTQEWQKKYPNLPIKTIEELIKNNVISAPGA